MQRSNQEFLHTEEGDKVGICDQIMQEVQHLGDLGACRPFRTSLIQSGGISGCLIYRHPRALSSELDDTNKFCLTVRCPIYELNLLSRNIHISVNIKIQLRKFVVTMFNKKYSILKYASVKLSMLHCFGT